ncbi:MAG: DUF962 domain-containing protein [Actinobacteria bacterium]|nr:MAG: DUF962 domain-containing protein [Actinomycetota bacterium]
MDVTNGVPGVNAPDPNTYEEFWPYYVSQHLHPATRAIHVGATSAAVVCGAAGFVFFNPLLVAAAPVIGYGPAFASHFLIEKNKPASFGHPVWSFRADFRQVRKFFTGRLEADVQQVRKALHLRPEQRTLAEAAKRHLRAA